MARIKSYANASPVVGADKWIGSDSQSNFATKKKNFVFGSQSAQQNFGFATRKKYIENHQ